METKSSRSKSATRSRKSPARTKQSLAESNGYGQSSLEINRDDIARLAYTFWEQRGCQGGSPEEDWLRAENELRGRITSAA